MDQQPSLTAVLESAAKLPLVRIDRTAFLTKNLSRLCTPAQLQNAIADGTLRAGIPIASLDSLANAIIHAETLKVTAASTAAGIPGGLAMAATIPADLTQFYGFVIRVAQELAYISTIAHMSPEEYSAYEAAIVVDVNDVEADSADITPDVPKTNCWICACGTENQGKFCHECGKPKPAGIPQYRCDKCGWEPDDKTLPPKFCPECGDQFDDGDIILV